MLANCTVCRLWAEQDEGPTTAKRSRRLRRNRGEIWQCDALGRYSGFPPPDSSVVVTAETAPRGEYLTDQTFLRGRQTTDAAGIVEFRTIYPRRHLPHRAVSEPATAAPSDVCVTGRASRAD